jgi:hypothetical protein
VALSTSARNAAVDAITAISGFASLHTADPGTTGASEVSGGSPAYARKAISWNAASSGSAATTATVTFDIPTSTTVSYYGLWSASSGGTFRGGGSLPFTKVYNVQGTYQLTSATVAIS